MLIVVLVIISLSLLILGHEAGHFLVAKLFGMKIDEFGFGFPPKIFGRKKGETEYSLNWLPFGGFVKIRGESDPSPLDNGERRVTSDTSVPEEEKKHLFLFQPAWRRALVVAAGVATNFLIGWFLISAVLMVGTPKAIVISGTQAGSPAESVGLMSGDIINGYKTVQDFVNFVNQNRGRPITISISRNGKDLSFTVTPRVSIGPNEGALGVLLAEGGEERQGFMKALWQGLKNSVYILGMTLQALYLLVKNLFLHGSLLQGVVGPVGIFSVAEEASHIGLIYFVQLMGLISLNLTVVNLIPFPALDGGRLLFIAAEKIKGSPVSRKIEMWANGLGFALLIAIMVLITIRDIGHWF